MDKKEAEILIDVSIIIVNYNTKELLRDCLKSIYSNTKDVLFEVIVSDNGSTDGSVDMVRDDFPQVILVENGENLGFGHANNIAKKKSSGKYIFFLNSDTILLNNAVKFFYDYFENTKSCFIGGIGAYLQDSDGTFIHSGGVFPTYANVCKERMQNLIDSILKYFFYIFALENLFLKLRDMKKSSNKKSTFNKIEYVSGADLFMRNNENAVFDERFFLYYEETDMEYQLAKKGKKFFLINGPKIIHLLYKGKVSKIQFETFSSYHSKISAIKFFEKNCQGKNVRLLFWLTKLIFMLPPNKKYLDLFKAEFKYKKLEN